MTSGQFASFPVDQIYIDRANRQRRTLEGIDELAASIHRVGLIHPPVIERDGQLRVGERRMTAIKQLGWTHVPVQFIDELDEHQLKQVELEENLRRLNLTWHDECMAVHEYYELRKSEPGWNQEMAADALGYTQQFVSAHLDVARELIKGNELIKEAPRFTVARNIVQRSRAREKQSTIQGLPGATVVEPEKEHSVLHADFHEWVKKSWDGPKFNFIHCDFPYGIGADEFDQGSAAEMGGYEDSISANDDLIASLELACRDRVAESAHLMFWFSMKRYITTKYKLEEMGWRIWDHPLIWHKSDNIGILSDAKRGPRNVYETCLFGSRGDRYIVRPVSNLMPSPTVQTIHMSEKPQIMLEKFMSMFVDKYSVVLDPTCGSGSSIRAARKLNARYALGLESNERFYTDAKHQLENGSPTRESNLQRG